jgi:hypothetical protein
LQPLQACAANTARGELNCAALRDKQIGDAADPGLIDWRRQK